MEELIIKGIDVSECEYVNCCSKKAKCIILQDDILSDSQYCESEPNCYYKQLKRLEQENAELKTVHKQLKRLQAENKRLQMLSCANCGEQYLSPDGAELYEKNVQLQAENEEMHERLRTIIYNATGGRLSYSTYTVQAVEQAFYDQLEILTEQRTKELEEENKALVKENEDMKKSFVSHSEFMDILENNPNINWEETAKENIYLINKYRKALEEIREMAKENIKEKVHNPDIDIILDKINEVLK